MRYIRTTVIGYVFFICQLGLARGAPVPVRLGRLIEAPQDFDGRLVRVQGFLVIWVQPRHGPTAILYLSINDAGDHLTKNAILVIPSQEMMQSRDRVDRRSVSLTGTFRAVRGTNGSYSRVLENIQNFTY